MATLVEQALDEGLLKTSHCAQSGVWFFLFNVFEQVILDLLRKGVIEEALDAYISFFRPGWKRRGIVEEAVDFNFFHDAYRDLCYAENGYWNGGKNAQ